jgi:hypothetical protein
LGELYEQVSCTAPDDRFKGPPYAPCLSDVLDRSMLLLADAGFDAAGFLHDSHVRGAQFLVLLCPPC